MVQQIARDAVHIKLRVPNESPLISVYEFCYAAGFGLFKMNASLETVDEIRKITDFEELKKRMHDLVLASDIWDQFPEGERLKKLIAGCRLKNRQLDGDSAALFEMGIKGN